MVGTKRNSQSYIFISLILCILLNYLLLSYIYAPNGSRFLMFFQNTNPTENSNLIDTPIPSAYEVKNVPALCQMPLLPTGCEATAATMLLQWAGVSVALNEVADALPKGPLPTLKGGVIIGGNPAKEFVGNPYLKSGLGIYNKPIYDVLNTFLPDQIVNMTGCSFDELLPVISSERPILVWATIQMVKPSINSVWKDASGNEVIWKIPEHAMLLIGYNETDVIIQDPLTGQSKHYDRLDFKFCWEAMGNQAITIAL